MLNMPLAGWMCGNGIVCLGEVSRIMLTGVKWIWLKERDDAKRTSLPTTTGAMLRRS